MPIHRRIYKQGNAFVISIPKYMLHIFGDEIPTSVQLTMTPRPSIEITPINPPRIDAPPPVKV